MVCMHAAGGALQVHRFSRSEVLLGSRDTLHSSGGGACMQEGSFRCDVNVSVRPAGTSTLGTKVEVKNMNSFGAMQKAIEFEVNRQSALLRDGRGGEISQETRLFDEDSQVGPVQLSRTSCRKTCDHLASSSPPALHGNGLCMHPCIRRPCGGVCGAVV